MRCHVLVHYMCALYKAQLHTYIYPFKHLNVHSENISNYIVLDFSVEKYTVD